MSAPILALGFDLAKNEVVITRGSDVGADVWLQLRGFWSSSGGDVARLIRVPIEAFMADRSAFVRRCRALGIGVDVDEKLAALAKQAMDGDRRFAQLLREPTVLSEEQVDELLAASRLDHDRLRPFQTRDLQKLLALDNGANFSVPGSGKTAVTLAIYEAERSRGRVEQLLVIAPLSAFGSWDDEVAEWLEPAPKLERYQSGAVPSGSEIVVANYHRLASNYDELARWVSSKPTMVVLDEAHRMKKGWQGEHGRACLSLAYRAVRRDILTGTPAPQGPRDFLALIDFIWPNQAVRVLPRAALVAHPPDDAMPQVASAIGPLFVRTNKKDLDLPEVRFQSIELDLEPLHAQIYDALRDRYAGELTRRERLDFARMNRVTMYMLEAATNPKLLTAGSVEGSDPDVFRHPPLEIPPGSRLAELLAQYNKYETPRKFIELAKLLKVNADQNRKTLVWTNFVRNLGLLDQQLARFQPALIHGSVPAYSSDPMDRTRETEIKRFRDDPDCLVLLANPAAMSEGISLHRECHDAIFLDRTFNAGQYLQSLDRIHRLGLEPEQETRFTFLLSNDTIDEVVDARVKTKAARLGDMLRDPDLVTVALPNEEDYGPPIDDEEDLEALFKHLRGDDEH